MPPEMVVLMSDLYNSPELKNHFCINECPIGKISMVQLEVAELDRLTIKVLSAFKKVNYIKDTLIDIAADGIISVSEKPQLEDVLFALDNISKNAQELKLWAEKNIGKDE